MSGAKDELTSDRLFQLSLTKMYILYYRTFICVSLIYFVLLILSILQNLNPFSYTIGLVEYISISHVTLFYFVFF